MKYIELYNEMRNNPSLKRDGLFNRLHVFNSLRTEDYKIKEKSLTELYRPKKEFHSLPHKEF